MLHNRSPPKDKRLASGGSKSSLLSTSSSSSSTSTTSNSVFLGNLNRIAHSHHHGNANLRNSSSSTISIATFKRNKKQNWGTRERAGMSFLIVIAFFAIFGIIILTEVLMIDDHSSTGLMSLRHGSYGLRNGDSMPDYDNVKDDYDLFDEKFMSDNKLGFVQLQDNKYKVQEASKSDAAGRTAGVLLNSNTNANANGGGGGGGGGFMFGLGAGAAVGSAGAGGISSANVPIIPWGKILPKKIEETLPPFPLGTEPTDGSWQVVNGTRFKFFVFSAFYDRRDNARLVRVIGATRTREPERVWCRFWYANKTLSAHGEKVHYTSATLMARVKIIRENWNLKYSACFVLCPVRTTELAVPHYVSIVSRLRAPPGNVLELRNTDWDADFVRGAQNNSTKGTAFSASASLSSAAGVAPPAAAAVAATTTTITSTIPRPEQIPDKIGICVKPFHFSYDQALYLIEYLEFYALLGVSQFTFYNHTIGPRATCVLQHYMNGDIPENLTAYDLDLMSPSSQQMLAEAANINKNSSSSTPTIKHLESPNYVRPKIQILPWNLRMRSQKEIRTEGLFAALNDCLYRNMYRYKYLALVDLDEFIVPRTHNTLNELISSLNTQFRNRNVGGYSFQNAFFYLQFPDDDMTLDPTIVKDVDPRVRASLVTQRKTKRRYKLHPQKQRSKYICKPDAVVEAGNHFVWEFSPGKVSLNVAPKDAILQHYRVCEFGGNDCIKTQSVVDRTATKYVNRLVQRVDTVYKHLRNVCKLPNLPDAITTAKEVKNLNNEMLKKPIIRRETMKDEDNESDKLVAQKQQQQKKTVIKTEGAALEAAVAEAIAAQLTTSRTNEQQTAAGTAAEGAAAGTTAEGAAAATQQHATKEKRSAEIKALIDKELKKPIKKYVIFEEGPDGARASVVYD